MKKMNFLILVIFIFSNLKSMKTTPQELLDQAIINDSSKGVVAALQKGANVNVGIGNQPPLLIAIISKKYHAAKALLFRKANPNIIYLAKPLYQQVLGKWDMLNAFLKNGLNLSDAEKKDLWKQLPLTNSGSMESLKLLDYNFKANFENTDLTKNDWYKLLSLPPRTHENKYSLVRLFIGYGANPNILFTKEDQTTYTPLLLVIDSYVKNSKDVNINRVLKVLIEAKANVNQLSKPYGSEESALSFAISNDKKNAPTTKIISLLLTKGALFDESINLYLKNGGDPNRIISIEIAYEKFSLLLIAVKLNNINAVKALLKAGANVNIKNPPNPASKSPVFKNTYTALKFAIEKGYGEIIGILIEYGGQC